MTVELRQGQRLANRFTLTRRLGSGGMSEVWLAQDDEFAEPVALKVLHERLGGSPAMVGLLEREHRNASRLIHSAIVRSFDLHAVDGLHFITMEAVLGGDFSRYVRTPPARFVPQLLPVVDALAYAHDEGIVHRDVKLSNVLCDRAGHAHLADFGLAALLDNAGDTGFEGGGSPYSRSPQQIQGDPPSPADDLYALGVLLYELIDGHPPFYPDISDDKVLNDVPRPPDGDAPEALRDLVMALLAKNPGERPATMSDVSRRLRAVVSADANATVPPEAVAAGASGGAQRFERIEPETFRGYAAPTAGAAEAERTVSRSGVLVGAWVALGALMLIGGVVFFYLPKTVTPGTPVVADAAAPADPAAAAAEADAPARPPPTGLTPWDTAQLARDREAAEAVLEELLALQFELEEQDVRVWADGRFDAARALAREGDQAYSERDYAGATERFSASLEVLKALDERAGTVLETTLQEAWAAYDDGDAARATERFELALKIDEGNADATAGLARAAKLPEVLTNMRAGADSESAGDVSAALERYTAAVELDADYAPAVEAVDRMRARLGDRQFNDAMSRGFVALEQRRFRDARSAFARALELEAGSSAARDALAQANLELRLGELAALQSAAVEAAEAERWDTALEKFNAVLALDGSVVFARDGAREAADRAGLDKQLERYIGEPERLSQDAVFSGAQQALAAADAVGDKGPRLRDQMQKLARLLAVARIPVPVRLVSDNATEVTILRVDRLGRFASRELELRPGTYTAVGVRDGYRDVRQEFTLAPGGTGQTVRVQCEERI